MKRRLDFDSQDYGVLWGALDRYIDQQKDLRTIFSKLEGINKPELLTSLENNIARAIELKQKLDSAPFAPYVED